MKRLRRYAPSLAVAFAAVLLAVMISFAVQKGSNDNQRVRDELIARVSAEGLWLRYDADIQSCNRGDVVRTILHEFLAAAIKARRSPPVEPGDLKAAAKYEELHSRIWPLKKCTDLIGAPNVPRPKKE